MPGPRPTEDMTDSLRDQLLTLGFKAPEPERRPQPRRDGGGKPRPQHPSGNRKGGPQGQGGRGRDAGQKPGQRRDAAPQRKPASEMDLGKAWALRAQQEKQERLEAEQRRQEEARQRREARARLEELLKDKVLNDEAADIARHFEYGGKIKRVYVNAEQLRRLNAGELGVIQLNGRYILVEGAVLAQAEQIFPQAVALKVDPNATAEEDPYADPRYQVPDDLVW
ncbi:Protein of unknown function DUF2058 [Pseudoxanthomonas suwonensis 11-1]|uniref:Nucleoprotein/polynucleotide-associated enzyme n=2 Tax=Pseudoxanthomonas suwonensis TaxID=314722 RepID=E6WTW1_PSEUU|nr:Protein of unknown function DUF2058 [Pseudoxanthomonas suwonensis 11-1]